MARTTLGLIVGNRDVFPAELARRGREEMIARLKKEDVELVVVGPADTTDGVIMTWKDAERAARLFHDNRARIDGIFVTLPNFGDERAIADTIKLSGLTVPVFIHAYPDEIGAMSIQSRRDSFCGKLSVCNNLSQYGIPYSIGRAHVAAPDSPRFAEELRWFLDVCRIVKGLRGARIGSIGERTTPFKTVRYSEKLLESSGISVESKSLLDTVGEIEALSDSDAAVSGMLAKLQGYLKGAKDVPSRAMLTTAKLGVVLDRWAAEYRISAYAIQCWSAMQGALKIFPCSIMSMMSNTLLPSACEVDVMGAVAMYALQLAGGTPSALFDWNNNYGDDPDKLVLFHCSNTATSFMKSVTPGYNAMAVKGNPLESCYCTLHGSLKPGPVGFARFTTDDVNGRIIGCVGDAEITADTLDTFGTTGVMKMAGTEDFLYFLTSNGFEHHMALNYSPRSAAVCEAVTRYMGWKVYHHNGDPRASAVRW
jgi:L-fucose isomerase-like protein